jgi:hypothetical protein
MFYLTYIQVKGKREWQQEPYAMMHQALMEAERFAGKKLRFRVISGQLYATFANAKRERFAVHIYFNK